MIVYLLYGSYISIKLGKRKAGGKRKKSTDERNPKRRRNGQDRFHLDSKPVPGECPVGSHRAC